MISQAIGKLLSLELSVRFCYTAECNSQSHFLPNLGTPVNWYSDYPDHYGTVEKGELLMESFVKSMVQVIKAVKADTETERLYREFFSRIGH